MPSFDIVCSADLNEARNAVDQTTREISTRFDFKGSKSTVELEGDMITVIADDNMKLKGLQEIIKQKLSKRGISLKSVTFEDPKPAGGDTIRQEIKIKQGLSDDELKKINKVIKAQKVKVNSQIQGDQLRITGKKKDDLQEMISILRAEVKDLDLQFTNFRD
jgi:uncharacterized protein YajQ (UPF0234 family)